MKLKTFHVALICLFVFIGIPTILMVGLVAWGISTGAELKEVTVKSFYKDLTEGRAKEAYQRFHPELKKQIDEPMFLQLMTTMKDRLGTVTTIEDTEYSGWESRHETMLIFGKEKVLLDTRCADSNSVKYIRHFKFYSDRLKDWFKLPKDDSFYEKRARKFLELYLGNKADEGWKLVETRQPKKKKGQKTPVKKRTVLVKETVQKELKNYATCLGPVTLTLKSKSREKRAFLYTFLVRGKITIEAVVKIEFIDDYFGGVTTYNVYPMPLGLERDAIGNMFKKMLVGLESKDYLRLPLKFRQRHSLYYLNEYGKSLKSQIGSFDSFKLGKLSPNKNGGSAPVNWDATLRCSAGTAYPKCGLEQVGDKVEFTQFYLPSYQFRAWSQLNKHQEYCKNQILAFLHSFLGGDVDGVWISLDQSAKTQYGGSKLAKLISNYGAYANAACQVTVKSLTISGRTALARCLVSAEGQKSLQFDVNYVQSTGDSQFIRDFSVTTSE